MTGICFRRLLAILLILAFPLRLLPQVASMARAAIDQSPDSPHFAASELSYARPVAPDFSGAPRGGTFAEMSRAAGLIFSGYVTLVGHPSSSMPISSTFSSAPTVITFQVESAIRGVRSGQQLTIHEWAGLWSSGERYRVGDHVLLFLFPPSKLGLTSPVAGSLGRFPVNAHGEVRMQPQQALAFASEPWVGKRNSIAIAEVAVAARLAGHAHGE